MKKKSVYLVMNLLILSIVFSNMSFGQISNNTTVTSQITNHDTKTELQRLITLKNDSKPEDVIIHIKKQTKRLELRINSSISAGQLSIEIYDPNGNKQGNFSIGTQLMIDKSLKTIANKSSKKETGTLSVSKSERVNGNIIKSLREPKAGKWKVKIIPTEATGRIQIRTVCIQ